MPMIHYSLRCNGSHEFEAWFRSSEDFDKQVQRRQVECPTCGDTKVAKALMAPTVRSGKANPTQVPQLRQQLKKLRDHVEKHCDYVGDQFADEARKIHKGDVEARNIYGESTDAEAAALTDEGVNFARIPWIKGEDS